MAPQLEAASLAPFGREAGPGQSARASALCGSDRSRVQDAVPGLTLTRVTGGRGAWEGPTGGLPSGPALPPSAAALAPSS